MRPDSMHNDGTVPAENDNARGQAGVIEVQTKTGNAEILPQSLRPVYDLTTLKARAAAHKLVVHAMREGGFIVVLQRWSLELKDATALAALLDRWEGRA